MMIELAFAVSQHTIPGDFNEAHASIRLQQRIDGGAFATVFHNSEDAVSVGLGYKVEATMGAVDLFAEGGLVTGYDYAPVLPLGRVGLEFNGMFRVWLAPAATPDGDMGAVVGVEIFKGFKF